jgi:hypothetical protein
MAGEREPGLIHGGNFLPPRSGVRPTTVEERRGVQQDDLARLAAVREAERAERAAAEGKRRAEADRLAALRARMAERVSEVGSVGITLSLPGSAVSLVVRPAVDGDQHDRLLLGLRRLVETALAWQAAEARAAAYEIESFAFEAQAASGELGRLIGQLQAEGLAEVSQ